MWVNYVTTLLTMVISHNLLSSVHTREKYQDSNLHEFRALEHIKDVIIQPTFEAGEHERMHFNYFINEWPSTPSNLIPF